MCEDTYVIAIALILRALWATTRAQHQAVRKPVLFLLLMPAKHRRPLLGKFDTTASSFCQFESSYCGMGLTLMPAKESILIVLITTKAILQFRFT